MAITEKKSLQNNQSILQNLALVEELDEQAAEIISGGIRCTIRNKTRYDIAYRLVGGKQSLLRPGEIVQLMTRGQREKIEFDSKEYNLFDKGIYEFREKKTIHDIYLHRVDQSIFDPGFNK
ncbi:MAG: hypothetical protein HCA25_02550 [Dolichospermum sp. DET50]|nr:hypothetical protein [Dolichospermum sp. DET66]MBS3031187.1 hypothetical protein [Dolichospermum sp. DET67]MBS3036397.1 hypothetical protein [Dolichospermum sp. DET50]QSX68455.1 MAG: hypothetical protein EZY12_01720 [Dolichospermum sp. DET69]